MCLIKTVLCRSFVILWIRIWQFGRLRVGCCGTYWLVVVQQLLDQSAINQSWECLDGHWMSGQDDHKSHLKKMSQRLSPKKTRHRGISLERKATKLVAHPASSMLDYRHFQGPRHNGRFYMLRPPEMGPWGEGGVLRRWGRETWRVRGYRVPQSLIGFLSRLS